MTCALANPRIGTENVFAEARRLVTWHYQWIILHEFLPQVVGASRVNRVLADRHRHYRPKQDDAFIPVEFQLAYRMGHSMVRPSYRANFTGNDGGPFFALLFDPSQEDAADPSDLRGGVRSPRRFVGWSTFFRFPGLEGDVRPNKRLDTHLSTPLFDLPLGAIASGMPPTSLAERNLLRHLTWLPPSGQAIAERLRCAGLAERATRGVDRHPSELRAVDAALVLRLEGSGGRRAGPSARAGRRASRRRGVHRIARERLRLVSERGGPVRAVVRPTPGAFTIVDCSTSLASEDVAEALRPRSAGRGRRNSARTTFSRENERETWTPTGRDSGGNIG